MKPWCIDIMWPNISVPTILAQNSQFHPFTQSVIKYRNLPVSLAKNQKVYFKFSTCELNIWLRFWKLKETSVFWVNEKHRVSLTSFCVYFSLVEPVCIMLQHVEWDSPMEYATHAQVHTLPAVSTERSACHLKEKMNGGKGEERKHALLPSTFHALGPCT